MSMSAAEFKRKGNEAFAAKRYDEALSMYDKAIALDPQNVDLFNNRSAANHSLKRYNEAIRDARKGLVITQSAKGYSRLGAALWSSGRLEEAMVEYERAQSLEPGNLGIQENLRQLREAVSTHRSGKNSSGGAGSSSQFYSSSPQQQRATSQELLADIISVAAGTSFLFCTFVFPSLTFYAWKTALLAMVVRQAFTLKAMGMFSYSSLNLQTWSSGFAPLYFLLCVVALATGVQPQMLIALCIVLYSLVDIVDNRVVLQIAVPGLYARAEPLLNKAVANRNLLLTYAATCELWQLFTIMFTGGAIFTLAYIQFVKMRFISDAAVRLSFSAVRMSLSRITRHRLCPPVIDRGFQKACDLLYTFAQYGH